MGSDRGCVVITAALARAWGLTTMSDRELYAEAADWGYGDAPQRFVEAVYLVS